MTGLMAMLTINAMPVCRPVDAVPHVPVVLSAAAQVDSSSFLVVKGGVPYVCRCGR
jgi:hypothetical protein